MSKAKSMRELVARKQYKIVQRYIDTFNSAELDMIADYVEKKRSENVVEDYPQQLLDYVASVGATIEKDVLEDDEVVIYTVAAGKRLRRIDEVGNIYKPKGKKVLGNIYDD